MYSQLTVAKLFDLSQTQAETLLNRFQYPWEALPHIKEFILALGPSLPKDEYEEIKENVWAAKSAVIFPTAYLNGPVIIGKNTEVRHGAFIRGSALVGDSAVVGNSTELKNVILFNNVQVPHYNYVGDSILGPYGRGLYYLQCKIRQDPGNGQVSRRKNYHWTEKVRRYFRGLRGGWLQLCSEPRKRHMSQQQYLSLIYGAGRGSSKKHL